MKFDNYICEIEIYCNSNKNNKKMCLPICYRICSIIDMVDNIEHNSILLDDYNHVCLIEEDTHNFQITPHIKLLKKNMMCFYKEICNFSDDIIKPIHLIDNKIEIFIMNEIKKAYIDRDIAFHENFIKDEQWKLYKNGYNGIHKEYEFKLNYDGYLREEYYHINGKIDGIKKVYNSSGDLIREENYVNGKLYGIIKIYDNNKIIEIRNYFNGNYYYVEKYNNNKIIYNGYYYLDINITHFIKLKQCLFG